MLTKGLFGCVRNHTGGNDLPSGPRIRQTKNHNILDATMLTKNLLNIIGADFPSTHIDKIRVSPKNPEPRFAFFEDVRGLVSAIGKHIPRTGREIPKANSIAADNDASLPFCRHLCEMNPGDRLPHKTFGNSNLLTRIITNPATL